MSKKKFTNYVWGSNVITLKYIIDIDSNLSSNDINNAKLSEWTSNKTLKIDVAIYLNKIIFHSANWNDDENILSKPTLQIEAIGDTNVALMGPTGVQGATGSGAQGLTGVQGYTGYQGFTGHRGVTGYQGFTGSRGAYNSRNFIWGGVNSNGTSITSTKIICTQIESFIFHIY